MGYRITEKIFVTSVKESGELAMSIESIGLKNFTVFEDFELEVSSGINLFIGENGTGKTHLLKAIYAACEFSRVESQNDELLKCFKEKQQEANLLRNKNIGQLTVSITSEGVIRKQVRGSKLLAPALDDLKRFNSNAKPLYSSGYFIEIPDGIKLSAVYIPVKDMLTHSAGFLAMANKYRDFPFDKTLTDIVIKASQWKVKQPPKLALAILPILEEMMGGVVVFENDEFYIKKNNGQMILFELEAEGLKKVGLLWQLLMTDNLNEDSILIWDEPEANLNPKFLPKIVECLLELSRHGVQIFLSTHNYIFAKYFDVAKKDNDSLLFHSLYFEEKAEGVKCETQPYFETLRHNEISAAFNHLLERVYQIQIED